MATSYSTPGLTATTFFESLSDQELVRFLDASIVSILNALFGGQITGPDLRRVVNNLVNMDALLSSSEGRKLVLSLIPDPKKAELSARVMRSIEPSGAADWSEEEIRRLLGFFGIVHEQSTTTFTPPSSTATPEYGLFDHQRRAVHSLKPLLANDTRRAVLHLPTGVGKTRTAMHLVADLLRQKEPSVVVWLASGRELLEQAVAAFRQAWKYLGSRPVSVGTMWGDRMPDLRQFSDGFLAVSLAKGWAVMSRTDPDWALRLSKRIRLIVFDEAHQSIARTYQKITEELTLGYKCALLGLTATPGRTWADIDQDGKLAKFYDRNKVTLEVPGKSPIEYLISNGYLARPNFKTLLSEPGIEVNEEVRAKIAQNLEIPHEVVDKLTMGHQYIGAVLSATEELLRTGHRRVLVFAATVQHGQILSAILIAREIRSSVVTSQTSHRARECAIRLFKSPDETPMVLVNFGVLTTGFDAPQASAVVIARPTKSLVLYSQMVGRAIRGPKAGGTPTCDVITVVDPSLPGFGDVADAFLNWEDVW